MTRTTHGRRPPEVSGEERECRSLLARSIRLRIKHVREPLPQKKIYELHADLTAACRRCASFGIAKMLRDEARQVEELILIPGDE